MIRYDEVEKNVPNLKRNKSLRIVDIPTHVLREKSFLVPEWLYIYYVMFRVWSHPINMAIWDYISYTEESWQK